MDSVEEVVIDGDGVFKYILIELTEKKKGGAEKPRTKLIVRGFEWAEFHGVFAIWKLARPIHNTILFSNSWWGKLLCKPVVGNTDIFYLGTLLV